MVKFQVNEYKGFTVQFESFRGHNKTKAHSKEWAFFVFKLVSVSKVVMSIYLNT
jgi:hypothetical protein